MTTKRASTDVVGGHKSKPKRKPVRKTAPKQSKSKSTFAQRDTASSWAQRSLDKIEQSLETQQQILLESLKQINNEITASTPKGETPATSLIEARTSILSGLKSLQATQTKFVLDLSKSKDLLAHLNPAPTGDDEKLTINIFLPDLTQIQIVKPKHNLPDDITGLRRRRAERAKDEDDDTDDEE